MQQYFHHLVALYLWKLWKIIIILIKLYDFVVENSSVEPSNFAEMFTIMYRTTNKKSSQESPIGTRICKRLSLNQCIVQAARPRAKRYYSDTICERSLVGQVSQIKIVVDVSIEARVFQKARWCSSIQAFSYSRFGQATKYTTGRRWYFCPVGGRQRRPQRDYTNRERHLPR